MGRMKDLAIQLHELASSTEGIRKAAETVLDVLMTLDPEGCIELCNAYAERRQASIEEAYGKRSTAITPGDDGWKRLDEAPFDGYEIGVRFMVKYSYPLGGIEVATISGILGYALAEVWRGEGLSEVEEHHSEGPWHFLTFSYDSTKTRSDDPDASELNRRFLEYLEHGTPVRKTNRSGPGTKGTRLIEGVAGIEAVSLWVR